MFNAITNFVGPKLGSAGLSLRSHSPEIYLVGAIGTGVASAVMLAKAHKHSDEVFEDVAMNIEEVHIYVDEVNNDEDRESISRVDEQRMLAPLYFEAARRGAILYGPAILMGISSIALLLASNRTLRRRNQALMSALVLFQEGFARYRQRVVDELGEEADARFYYGAESRTVTELTKGEDGKTSKKKGTKNHIPEKPTPMIYSRVFDETNVAWQPDKDMNEFFIRAVKQQIQDKLDGQGYVTLNTVYDALCFEDSPEGAVVGWSHNVPGDRFISFGLDNDINQREGDNRFFLDFNVNGVILDQIGAK